jgi:hypothetical protein
MKQNGYSMIEVLVTVSLLLPLIGLIAQVNESSTRGLSTNDQISRAMERLERTAQRIAKLTRPCSLDTLQMEANAEDIRNFSVSAGTFLDPLPDTPRTGVRFQSSTHTTSFNATNLTSARTIQKRLDPRETENGRDDDGDGLVDEGSIVLTYEGTQAVMDEQIEDCMFALTGPTARLLTVQLSSGVPQRGGGVRRFTITETLFLRNN